jgi:hypothetical protein
MPALDPFRTRSQALRFNALITVASRYSSVAIRRPHFWRKSYSFDIIHAFLPSAVREEVPISGPRKLVS